VTELKKVEPIELRAAGLDEKWLQAKILDDTSLLGLGELEVFSRERRQPTGGKIDFLLYSESADTYYEVEVMLGTLDESHIIRTIEYWDIERQRRPGADHRAVIVAEKITSRFFNVLRLLNRSVPMIAVQLGAFKLDEDNIALHCVTVLNVTEDAPEAYVAEEEQADRRHWEKKSDLASLAVMDKIVAAMRNAGYEVRLTYNKNHISLGSTGNYYCFFHPRKGPGFCHFDVRLDPEERDEWLNKLQQGGAEASPKKSQWISLSVNDKTLDSHMAAIVEVLKQAELNSR
jgi:hypothetical protein